MFRYLYFCISPELYISTSLQLIVLIFWATTLKLWFPTAATTIYTEKPAQMAGGGGAPPKS